MKTPKYFVCPISKQIVDSILKLQSDRFGLAPTRRQVDYNSGYVNGWDTASFCKYVRGKSDIVLGRDHAGPNQGKIDDDGMVSYKTDASYFDIIHIDPWKIINDDKLVGIVHTYSIINYLYNINPNLKFEILTEETITQFNPTELDTILQLFKLYLSPDAFTNIEFVVIQSGVGLDLVNMRNTGRLDLEKLKKMVNVCRKFDKKPKEHNGDYLSNDELKIRFDNGVDSFNIGPELAQIQTLTYLEYMNEKQIDEFYQICLRSKKWERWVTIDFDIKDKHNLIQICGHYCYNKYELPDIDSVINERIQNKLNNLP
jgi:hypothetical protein